MTIEETGTAPAPAAVVTPVNTAPEAPETITATQADVPQPTPAPEPKKVDPRQRKIAELSYQLRESNRNIDRLIGLAEKQAQARQAPEDDRPPNIGDFQDVGEYVRAEYAYLRKQEAKATQSNERSNSSGNEDYSRQASVKAAGDELVEVGSEKYEDFADVVFSPNVRITEHMADAIFNLDDPGMKAEIAYYLAKNSKEALQISRLAPSRQAAEIGKLEMKLSAKPEPQKKPSAAPEPITPVSGSKTPIDEIAPVMPFDKFMQVRNKQLGRK